MTEKGSHPQPAEQRFWNHISLPEDIEECWLWKTKSSNRYPTFRDDSGTKVRVHRYAYELIEGPITKGLEPDHLCRNILCVNPLHLELVTHRTNVLRGNSPMGINSRKTHCIHGHQFNKANTYVSLDGKSRTCRICRTATKNRWKQRHH